MTYIRTLHWTHSNYKLLICCWWHWCTYSCLEPWIVFNKFVPIGFASDSGKFAWRCSRNITKMTVKNVFSSCFTNSFSRHCVWLSICVRNIYINIYQNWSQKMMEFHQMMKCYMNNWLFCPKMNTSKNILERALIQSIYAYTMNDDCAVILFLFFIFLLVPLFFLCFIFYRFVVLLYSFSNLKKNAST